MNQLPGRKAAEPKTLEDDQEIVMSIRFKAHGSDNHAEDLIERVVRQLSVIMHRDINLIRYYIERPESDGKTEQARD